MIRLFLSLLFLSGCVATHNPKPADTSLSRSVEFQKEIDELLKADAENKKWEKIYLEEIRIAQENLDYDAYRFFLAEYVRVPRLRIPDWVKE